MDKRAFMRDMRSARLGLSRRIRLRVRTTAVASVASVDPLSNAAPAPSTDSFTYVTGAFNLLKTTQDYSQVGAEQAERGVVYFHPMLKASIEKSYSMYIGGTGKEWVRKSPVTYDDVRCSLRVIVEATQ